LKAEFKSQSAKVNECLPAILLVGGKGTRLQSVVSSKPKPLADVGGNPFLELLVMQLRNQGIQRLIMSTGYLAEQIEEAFGDGRRWGVEIRYSKEAQPLGTAGAVRFAEAFLERSSEFLVLNGDSFIDLNIRRFIDFHRQHDGIASMAVCRVSDAARFGTVELGDGGRVARFREKTGSTLPGLINAGVYAFKRSIVERIPQGIASFEKDVFPALLNEGIYALEEHGIFIDIGTPQDYAYAQDLCEKLCRAATAETQVEADKPSTVR